MFKGLSIKQKNFFLGRWESDFKQNSFIFHEKNVFSFKCMTLHISKINSFLHVKRNKRLLDKSGEPLDTTVSCMDQWLWVYMFVQPWKSFLEELKTAKQMIIIPKCNGRPIREEKNDINIAITESTKNVYHVTRQNLRFVHAPCNKKS